MSMAHYNSTALFTKLSELLHYNYTLLSGNKVGNIKNLPKINTLNKLELLNNLGLIKSTEELNINHLSGSSYDIMNRKGYELISLFSNHIAYILLKKAN